MTAGNLTLTFLASFCETRGVLEARENSAAGWPCGFLLTQEWQDTASGCVATFWGKGDDGPFALRTAVRPVLFVAQGLALPDGLSVAERRSLPLRNFQRQPVEALYFRRQRDLLDARERLRTAGVSVFEGDIGPSERHLMERFIHASCAFSGSSHAMDGYRLYDQPRMQRADYRPHLTRLSLRYREPVPPTSSTASAATSPTASTRSVTSSLRHAAAATRTRPRTTAATLPAHSSPSSTWCAGWIRTCSAAGTSSATICRSSSNAATKLDLALALGRDGGAIRLS